MLGRFLGFSVLVPAVLGAVVVGAVVLLDLERLNPPDPDPLDLSWAQPGDCLKPSADSASGWMWVSCRDPQATQRIRAVLADGECIEIPGADFSRRLSETFCLGDKTADPAASINGISTGECTTADGTARQDCAAPGHRVVLAVLEHRVAVQQPAGDESFVACAQAGAAGTDTVVNRSLVQEEGASLLAGRGGRWARSLCLSQVR